MDEAGLIVYNESAVLTIDSTYYNLTYLYKTSISTGGSYWSNTNGSCSFGTITVSSRNPVLALRCQDYCSIAQATDNGTSSTFYIVSEGPTTVEVYVFSEPDIDQSGVDGLQVFNEQTELVFDSNVRFLKVQDTLIDVLVDGVTLTRTFPKKPAVVQVQRYYHDLNEIYGISGQERQFIFLMSGAYRTTDTQVQIWTMSEFVIGPQDPVNWPTGLANPNILLIIDVDGYT